MKTCRYCNTINDDETLNCKNCGGVLGIIPDLPTKPKPEPTPVQPQVQQTQPQVQQAQPQMQAQNVQTMHNPAASPQQADAVAVKAPMSSRTKKIIIIASAAVAVVALIIVLVVLLTRKSYEEKIIGTWKLNGSVSDSAAYWTFRKDGTAQLSSQETKYSIKGDSLVIDLMKTTGYKELSTYISIADISDDTMTLVSTYTLNGSTVTSEQKFTRVTNDSEIRNITNKQKLKTANANAKLIFTTINNNAADLIADGVDVQAIRTDGPIPVEQLQGSSNVLLRKTYEELEDNGTLTGYVYIDYDPSADYSRNNSSNFVQWSESMQDLIGQYPSPPKSADIAEEIEFGKMHSATFFDN